MSFKVESNITHEPHFVQIAITNSTKNYFNKIAQFVTRRDKAYYFSIRSLGKVQFGFAFYDEDQQSVDPNYGWEKNIMFTHSTLNLQSTAATDTILVEIGEVP